MHRLASLVAAFLIITTASPTVAQAAPNADVKPIVVGSKRFTESYILGEIVRETLTQQGIAAVHKPGLGNTGILAAALASGAIDVYPEYTGTIVRELLKRDDNPTFAELNALLADKHLKVAAPFGFSNTYALAMREGEAARLGIARISDLADAKAARLALGFSNEFLARADGWPALKRAYALPFETPAGLDHGLAYDALAKGRVDVVDIYSTDAKIARDKLRVLEDDRHFFPKYDAVLLMKSDLDPAPFAALRGAIDTNRMIALNGEAELDGLSFAQIAKKFVTQRLASTQTGTLASTAAARSASPATPSPPTSSLEKFAEKLFAPDFWRLLAEHVFLVAGSVTAACLVGIPLGVWAARRATAGRLVLGAVGVLQTIPSLALLAFLIALLGTIGTIPALVALFLYALLPIVANTHAGLAGVARGVVAAAAALGLSARQRLTLIELPLAAPTIAAGVKTAAVINVGTATMAAFIGAGGFGERITAGLALNDGATMLAGALPAAGLALVVQGAFEVGAWLNRDARSARPAR